MATKHLSATSCREAFCSFKNLRTANVFHNYRLDIVRDKKAEANSKRFRRPFPKKLYSLRFMQYTKKQIGTGKNSKKQITLFIPLASGVCVPIVYIPFFSLT